MLLDRIIRIQGDRVRIKNIFKKLKTLFDLSFLLIKPKTAQEFRQYKWINSFI